MRLKNFLGKIGKAGKSIIDAGIGAAKFIANTCKKHPTTSTIVGGSVGVGLVLTATMLIAMSSLSSAVSDVSDQLSSLSETGQDMARVMQAFDGAYQTELEILDLEEKMAADAALEAEQTAPVEHVTDDGPGEKPQVLDYYETGGYDIDVQIHAEDYLSYPGGSNALSQEFKKLTPKTPDQAILFAGNMKVVAHDQDFLDEVASLNRSERINIAGKFAYLTRVYAANRQAVKPLNNDEQRVLYKDLGKTSDVFCRALFPYTPGDQKWCMETSMIVFKGEGKLRSSRLDK